MTKGASALAFYIVLIIVLALIGYWAGDVGTGLVGASAGLAASGILYEMYWQELQ